MNLTKAKETKTRVCCLYRVSTKGQVDKAENDIPMQKKACHEFAECCFSKRMRNFFRKNEKSVLQFCNKKPKRKGRLQRVEKSL